MSGLVRPATLGLHFMGACEGHFKVLLLDKAFTFVQNLTLGRVQEMTQWC